MIMTATLYLATQTLDRGIMTSIDTQGSFSTLMICLLCFFCTCHMDIYCRYFLVVRRLLAVVLQDSDSWSLGVVCFVEGRTGLVTVAVVGMCGGGGGGLGGWSGSVLCGRSGGGLGVQGGSYLCGCNGGGFDD